MYLCFLYYFLFFVFCILLCNQVFNQHFPEIARARFLRAASTENQISYQDDKEYIDKVFKNYSISIKNTVKESKKSLKMIMICEKMIVNLFLLSTSPCSHEVLAERGIVYDHSLKSILK